MEEDEGGSSGEESGDSKDSEADDGGETERFEIAILDSSRETIRTLDGESLGRKKGLNRVAWDLAMDGPRQRTDEKAEVSEFDGPPRGPWVLPGTYTVRLTVDGEVVEAPVEVRVDPSVEVSLEDLQEQYRVVRSLQDKVSVLNDGLRRIDVVDAQLEARRETAKSLKQELPEDLLTAFDEYESATSELLDELARAEDKPYWSQGPRLSDRLQSLAQGDRWTVCSTDPRPDGLSGGARIGVRREGGKGQYPVHRDTASIERSPAGAGNPRSPSPSGPGAAGPIAFLATSTRGRCGSGVRSWAEPREILPVD